MLALDLNLASRPFKNNTLLWTGYVTGLVLLVAFSVWNVVTWTDHGRRLAELRAEVGSIEGQMGSLDQREALAREATARFDLKALAIQTFKANEVIEWRAFSWTRLFNVMEQVQPNNVRMTSIRPLFRAGRRENELGTTGVALEKAIPVALDGLAKDHSALLDLEAALFADPHVRRVLPERWVYNDARELVFSLTFVYHPDVETAPPEETEEAAAPATPDGDGPAGPPGEEPAVESGPAQPGAAEAAAAGPGAQPAAALEAATEAEPGAAPPEGAEAEERLIDDADPKRPPPRPFVKGRTGARGKRGGQP